MSRKSPGPIPATRAATLSTRASHGSGAFSFSTKGEYGVRLMVQLGRRFGAGPVSLAEVAEAEALPRAYLEQLVIGLREAGLVVSTRGAHGGYQLSRPPAEIGMGEVLRALEGPIAPMICAVEGPAGDTSDLLCERGAGCTVSMLWVRVRDAIVGTLDSTTLDELLQPHARTLITLAPRETISPALSTASSTMTHRSANQ